jgi:hypothetical protein
MNFTWDVLGTSNEGHAIVYKRVGVMSQGIRSKRDARAAANRDALLTNNIAAQHDSFIAIIDVSGIRFRAVVYTYIKELIKENAARPVRTHVVNAPKWTSRVYRAVRPLLSAEDVQSASVHTGPYDPLGHI